MKQISQESFKRNIHKLLNEPQQIFACGSKRASKRDDVNKTLDNVAM